MLRASGCILVSAIFLAYLGRLESIPPIVGRTLVMAGLLAMAVAYELDRRDAR
jgi:hypothetical protein